MKGNEKNTVKDSIEKKFPPLFNLVFKLVVSYYMVCSKLQKLHSAGNTWRKLMLLLFYYSFSVFLYSFIHLYLLEVQ